MKSHEIREAFLTFFENHGHRRVPSSSLIPANDPTLLFANAGMNQFKDLFLGREKRDYSCAVSSQKCVRAGGKHNDLDNVGYTARHQTFFEMLGNFSFGDYFKERAIELAWTFLTQTLAIPADRLFVTVYEEDDEAFAIWRNQIGIPAERIFRFGKKDNFWAMGETGPCGPCSEIFYDYGDAVPGPADPYEAIASGSDRIVEVWNLVFMQYDCLEDGTLVALPNPSIDTGMGLERISCALQGVTSNYGTDLFQDIIGPLAAFLGVHPGADRAQDAGLRVIADHLRAMSFLIADGVAPSNEGRGYVLRRIMRRAMRFGKQLGQDKPFLFQVVSLVVDKMGDFFPELRKERAQIELLVKVEEQQFDSTLTKGMPILTRYLDQLRGQGLDRVPGQVLHYMYGTHGFPLDLMADIARDAGMTLDEEGFRAILAEEAVTNREAGEFTAKSVNPQLETDSQNFQTVSTCHQGLSATGTLRRILVGESPAAKVEVGAAAILVLDRTAFYAESGGQVGDKGEIVTESGTFHVEDTTKVLDRLVLHHGRVTKGWLGQDQQAQTHVDGQWRRDTMKNHTATHLLHQALRQIVGLHVRQAGSLVDPDKLRFDFSHFAPLSGDEITQIEELVNRKILDNLPIETREMDREQAFNSGAIAFFGDKYGETVRVVGAGDFSKEFCGGTHVAATGAIGVFKIISEKGLAAGVRRLVALTGPKALQRFQDSEAILKEAQDRFFLTREGFVDQLAKLLADKRALELRIDELKIKLAKGGGAEERIVEMNGFKVMVKHVGEVGGGQLRQLADEMLQKIRTGVVLLGSAVDGKAQLLVKTNVATVHAGNLVRDMAEVVGGKGGGRPDMAMAGGKNPDQISAALETGLNILQNP